MVFTPTTANFYSATLTVSEAAHTLATATVEQTISQQVSVSGRGGAPSANFAPFNTTFGFGNEVVGGTTAAHVWTLTNTSGFPLTFAAADFVFAGTGANQYAQTNTCVTGSPIANNGTCQISVTFAPTSTGTKAATLPIGGAATPLGATLGTLTLSGNGIAAAPILAIAPANGSSNNFGTVTPGQPAGLVRTFTVTNTGPVALTIGTPGITVTNTNGGVGTYTVVTGAGAGTCAAGGTLAATTGSCTVNVRLTEPTTPTTGRRTTATVTVSGTSNGTTYTVSDANLTGN